MIGADPPQEVFFWKQLAVLTCVCECNGSRSSFFAYDVPQETRAFPHYALRVRAACIHVFQTCCQSI